jgi:hypothetical protein
VGSTGTTGSRPCRRGARIAALAAALACVLAGGAGAQPPPASPPAPDSLSLDLSTGDKLAQPPAEPPVSRLLLAESDSIRAARTPKPRGRFDQPHWVMLRSLVIPGWGQFHNKAWFKSAAVAIGESWMIVRMVDDEKSLNQLEDSINQALEDSNEAAYNAAIAAYNSQLDQTTQRRWFFGALLAYALLDAYVDAHFVDFEVEFGKDGGGRSPSPPAPEARLKVRWSF